MSKFSDLRKLTRQHASHEDHPAWQEQVQADLNDRGACLLLAANVEAGLDSAIEQTLTLPVGEVDGLYNEDGPLGNFARKIAMGFALKIYGTATRSNLTIIRHVRNAFAHAKIPIRFDTPEVAAACGDLIRLPPSPPHVVGYEKPEPKTPREMYKAVCDTTSHNLFVFSLFPVVEIANEAVTVNVPEAMSVFARKNPLP